jgi:nucleotide-binding universal stress UspA family protein
MFHRILIPTDFSTASEWVFDEAVRIAGMANAEIVVLHVRMTWSEEKNELRFPADPSLYEYAEKLELERLRERIRRGNADVSTRLIVRQAPDPGAEICSTAASEKADLIVISTHARHHVSHLLVGSTTLTVLKNPPVPVLAIRYGTRKRTSFERVLVPVHFEQTSRAALDLATRLATEVNVVTVCREGEHSRAEAHLREIAPPGAKTNVIKGTDPEREIIRCAQKSDVDAIFLNAGDVSDAKQDIVRHAPVPVMIVP